MRPLALGCVTMAIAACGGEVVVENGIIHDTSDGVCLYACNDSEITTNGDNFFCENNGAIFAVAPYRTGKGPKATSNGGTFDASKAALIRHAENSVGTHRIYRKGKGRK